MDNEEFTRSRMHQYEPVIYDDSSSPGILRTVPRRDELVGLASSVAEPLEFTGPISCFRESVPNGGSPFDTFPQFAGDDKNNTTNRGVPSMSELSVCASDDILSTSWPPRPSIELVSRSARRWKTSRALPSAALNTSLISSRAWDFSELSDAADSASAAFKRGCARAERPLREGVSGTYFLKREDETPSVLCVFKPVDEEPDSVEDPVSLAHSASPIRTSLPHLAGFQAREGAYKEVAAYLLDHDNFAGVPQTALARCQLPLSPQHQHRQEEYYWGNEEEDHLRTKMGAFQAYVPNVGDADDFGPLVLPKEKANRIAVFDIRTLNHDRHGGNLLVSRAHDGTLDLSPIDHGYILPSVLSICSWPIWMDWPFCREPVSQEIRDYVDSLSVDRDAKMLREELPQISRASLLHMKFAAMLLKKGLNNDLTLFEIGTLIFSRDSVGDSARSELTKIVEESVNAGLSREIHLEVLTDHGSRAEAEAKDDLENSDSFKVNGGEEYKGNVSQGRLCDSTLGRLNNEMSQATEDYVVKYAGRLMDRLISRVRADKLRDMAKVREYPGSPVARGRSGSLLMRARSIPDYVFQELMKEEKLYSRVLLNTERGKAQSSRALPPVPGSGKPSTNQCRAKLGSEKLESTGSRKQSPLSVRGIDWTARDLVS